MRGDIERLIERLNEGDDEAKRELFAAAYDELRELAHSRLRQGGRHSCLDTTALVHESYLLFAKAGALRSSHRAAFFSYASLVMRAVIVNAVRQRKAECRGGAVQHISIDSMLEDSLAAEAAEVLSLDDELRQLEKIDSRLAKVVEMRYFGGCTELEIGETLGIDVRTVRRDWKKARLLLQEMLMQPSRVTG